MLLVYAILAGLLLGRLLGGRVAALERVTFHWWPLALGGLLFQVLLFSDLLGARVGDALPALYVASTLVVLVAAVRNARQPGFALVVLGAALNLVAILSNGGLMPSSPEARLALNGSLELGSRWTNSTLAAEGTTQFAFLGDVFVLPRPLPFANAFSIGDVLIALGAMAFLIRAMRPRPGQRDRHADPALPGPAVGAEP